MALRYDRTGFKDIVICQDPDEFCYGTDAVILAHEASRSAMALRKDCAIADLGTGTGIVPLILSQKTACASPFPLLLHVPASGSVLGRYTQKVLPQPASDFTSI